MKLYKTIYINQDIWERVRKSAEDNQRKYSAEIERLLKLGLEAERREKAFNELACQPSTDNAAGIAKPFTEGTKDAN